MSPDPAAASAYRRWGKRALDVTVASAALVVLAPLALGVAAVVAGTLGRPVLFRQRRPGLGGRPFLMYKFRTMSDRRAPDGTPLPDDQRLGRTGALLRATSLDELPELFNVLRGDMSLVGPRPLLVEYLPLYTPEQMRRHDVRPGITGLAQVSGRNALTWEEKFELDVWYVDHHSLVGDLRILLRTLRKVAGGEGVTEPGQATATAFRGSPPAGR